MRYNIESVGLGAGLEFWVFELRLARRTVEVMGFLPHSPAHPIGGEESEERMSAIIRP